MSFLYEREITVLNEDAFKDLLLWGIEIGASDIHIQPFTPIKAQVNQKVETIHEFSPSEAEVQVLVDVIFGNHANGVLAQGEKGLNDDYPVRIDRYTSRRFRINASPCYIRSCDCIQITARVGNEHIPTLDELNIENEIRDSLQLGKGLVLITGTMGTGKTTLLASLVRSLLENPQSRKNIITAESPIEYVFDDIEHNGSLISQTSIPRQFKTFHTAVVEATRRKPHVFVLGEARELETFRAVIEASQLGMLVFTTLHTNSVASTINRIVNQFHKDEQSFQKANIVDAIQLIVSQTLVPSTQGGLIALREILPIKDAFRYELMAADVSEIATVGRELVSTHGQSMFKDAESKHKYGLIDDYQLNYIRHSYGEY